MKGAQSTTYPDMFYEELFSFQPASCRFIAFKLCALLITLARDLKAENQIYTISTILKNSQIFTIHKFYLDKPRVCLCLFMCVFVSACMYVCMRVYVCVCVCVCVFVCVSAHPFDYRDSLPLRAVCLRRLSFINTCKDGLSE